MLFLTKSQETGPPASLPHPHPSLSSRRHKKTPICRNRCHAQTRPGRGVVKKRLFVVVQAGVRRPYRPSRDLFHPRTGHSRGQGSSDKGRVRELGMNTCPTTPHQESSSPLAKPSEMPEGKGDQVFSLRGQRLVSRAQSGY